jgi:hypothetical protein
MTCSIQIFAWEGIKNVKISVGIVGARVKIKAQYPKNTNQKYQLLNHVFM